MLINDKISLDGWSSSTADVVRSNALAGRAIISGGDFIAHSSKEIITSTVSALPWYYYVNRQGYLFHGPNVFDIAAKAGIDWKWNNRALVSLALFGHTIGDDTLHEEIARVPPGSYLVRNDNGTFSWNLLPSALPEVWGSEHTADVAVEALSNSFDDCVANECDLFLSLSGGYDSRLLLACALSKGLSPRLGVMGYAQTHDRLIAGKIAKDLGLNLAIIELDAGDYLKNGRAISYQTSGVKTAANWHTWIYSKHAPVQNAVHLVGSNGEFARSFYLDNSIVNWIADSLPVRLSNLYFDVRLARRRMKFSRHNHLVHGSHYKWSNDGAYKTAKRVGGAQTLSDGLDAFYSWQRVRHFIGAGTSCLRISGRPRSPFLDGRWVSAVAAMDRNWKRNNSFHRHCIKIFYPALAEYPYQIVPGVVSSESYNPFHELSGSAELEEFLMDTSELDIWFTRDQRHRILTDDKADQTEERSFMLTLLFARQNVINEGLTEEHL